MTNFWLSHLRRTLASGLILLLPVTLTYLIVRFLFDIVDGLLRPGMRWFLGQLGIEWTFPGPGLIAAVLLVYLFGLIMAFGLGRRVAAAVEGLLAQIPLIGKIYSTNHQLIASLSGTNARGFQRVVLVEFPREDTWSLGFLTGICETEELSKHIMAYVPTAPLPNSGFVVFLPPKSVLDTDLSPLEAMQFIFSGGFVWPGAFKTRKIDVAQLEKALNFSSEPSSGLMFINDGMPLGEATTANPIELPSDKLKTRPLPAKWFLVEHDPAENIYELPAFLARAHDTEPDRNSFKVGAGH